MQKINLRELYPDIYKTDTYLEVTDEVQAVFHAISRTSAYNLVKKKAFHSVRIGGSIRISKKSFDEWLDQQI